MYIIAKLIHTLFPLIALIFLFIGIKRNSIYFIISALWLSLIALIIHFQMSGGQILGSYFDYLNAAIYSLNLIILLVSLMRVISHLSVESEIFHYTSSLVKAFMVIACLLMISNLWINAYFIDNRMEGTPVMQVGLFEKPDYCSYRYVFFKISEDGSVIYMCPNHYGLIPSLGRLTVSPDFITSQLSLPVKRHMLLLQKKGS